MALPREWSEPQVTELSAIGGIVDPYGGLRCVVTKLRLFKHHVRCDEMLFVVPDLWIKEPCPWNAIPYVIGRVEHHISEWISTRNDPDGFNQNIKMYRLRCLEDVHSKGSLDLESIVET